MHPKRMLINLGQELFFHHSMFSLHLPSVLHFQTSLYILKQHFGIPVVAIHHDSQLRQECRNGGEEMQKPFPGTKEVYRGHYFQKSGEE